MANVLGNLIQEQGQGWSYDPQNGETLVRRWRGLRQYAEAYYSQLKSQSGVLSVSIDQDGDSPIYVVTAKYGQIQEGAETDGSVPYFWELAGNMIEISIYNHPKFKSAETIPSPNPDNIKMTDEQKNLVRQAFLNIETEPNPSKDGWITPQKQLWNLLTSGVENYIVSSWVFRLTRTFSKNFSTSVPVVNVGKVYTYSQIQNEANNVINAPISNAVSSNVPSDGEWLKQAPTITEISNNKVQWTQEWWWALDWSNILYDAAT